MTATATLHHQHRVKRESGSVAYPIAQGVVWTGLTGLAVWGAVICFGMEGWWIALGIFLGLSAIGYFQFAVGAFATAAAA